MPKSKPVGAPPGAGENPIVHVDDFLSAAEQTANRELLAAFAFVARSRGIVKQDLATWRDELERFLHALPE